MPPSNSLAPARDDLRAAVLISFLLFSFYLLTFSGRITSSDGLSMFAVTESLGKRGDFTTDQLWTLFNTKSIAAPDGESYSKYGYGTSLLAAPFYLLALYIPFADLMPVTLLSCALAIALAGGLVYLVTGRAGFSPRTSAAAALLFGLATPAWVYAREFWSESFSLLTLLAAFYLLMPRDPPTRTRPLLAGVCLGLAIAVRTTNILLVPLYLCYGFRSVRPFRPLILFLAPVLLFVLSVLLYNEVRFASPFATGYRPDEMFSNPFLLGAYGLLFSPGKGLFVYSPFLAALPYGVWRFSRRGPRRRELAFGLLFFAIYVVLFALWYYWWGGTNWGPRFLVPTLPYLVLLCAPLLELLLDRRSVLVPAADATRPVGRGLGILFLLLVLWSVVGELAGVLLPSLAYRLRALELSANADWDMIFDPALSPLLGHWRFLRLTNVDLAWVAPSPRGVQFDPLALLAALALVTLAAALAVRALRGRAAGRRLAGLSLVVAVGLTTVFLARLPNDTRLGGNAGYREAIRTIQAGARAGDVLILADDAQARFFLNTNRAPVKWYGLSRDPARYDDATIALLDRVTRMHPRVWLAYDDAVPDPNPVPADLAARLAPLSTLNLADGVHLILYRGATP